MATAVVIVMMVFFLAMGLYGLLVPAALIRPFGMIAGSAEARAEIRAVYGGFGVGIAVLLALALADVGGIRRGAVVAVAVALLGMALGRLTAHLVERPSAFYPSWLYFWVEAAGGGLLLATGW
ncbi:DUF4345 family protein [Streptosporangium lutulentum]|uniref:DUF4345 domain-containing protein n=1 Tax=Streptosporangium lutulentum TaxID=1461250 RepID=A0ABT9QJW2_9ACTN|nr:DUF4345 family protein [Streptosporangium lutulentum]MDP9847051.1 hypothetical protein [Streptosporangium lutulentum]